MRSTSAPLPERAFAEWEQLLGTERVLRTPGNLARYRRGTTGSQVQPAGRTVKIRYTAVYTYRGNRIAAVHLYFDQVELLGQLGAHP